MSSAFLEVGAAIVTLLVVLEMRRQQRPWRVALGVGVAMLATFTAMIVMWRGR